MLEFLHLKNVGPAPEMQMDLAPRLNVITGDNGLGKTLLLDVAWRVLTSTWPESWPGKGVIPAGTDSVIRARDWPRTDGKRLPATELRFDTESWTWGGQSDAEWTKVVADRNRGVAHDDWIASNTDIRDPLVVYARVDGGISIFDSLRTGESFRAPFGQATLGTSHCFQLTALEIWDGYDIDRNGTRSRVGEGLLRDWRQWALDPKDDSFARFRAVVQALSPHERLDPLKDAKRVFIDDARDVPLLRTPTGDVPVVHASAGIKRMLGLAYMLVWAAREHLIAANMKHVAPADSLVLLFDEVESHLHPKWQRQIARAMLGAAKALRDQMHFQAIFTTHSPLVLASLEPEFDEEQDRVFHLRADHGAAQLEVFPWAKQGDVVNWLVAEPFGLSQGRSVEAEQAIEAANAWMRGERDTLPADLNSQDKIHQKLLHVLAGHDAFWPRWIVNVEKSNKP